MYVSGPPPSLDTFMRPNLALATLLFISSSTQAQQFVERPGVLPGPPVWSECVVPIDVNGDNLLDLFIVNAQGYAVPGDYGAPSSSPLRPTLLMHTGTINGIPSFQEQTAALIPASIVVHGKSVAVCDVDGDGREDMVIAVAFGDQQRLLLKDPVGPGYLDETFRLPPLVLNSFHVGWGDLDDDGDIDLVFTDAGPSSFTGPGGKARLLINDGFGFFTDAPNQLNAIRKIGAQNAKIVDLDGDLDLDIVIDGKSSITQVYFNDGSGSFTLDTQLVPAAVQANSGGAYEVEWGDMDGDTDLDCLYMNFAGGAFPTTNIAMENRLAETGALRLRSIPSAFNGQNAQDENEFAFLDADDDGDLDVLVAALNFGTPITSEKLFMNSGTIGPGFLTQAVGAFPGTIDATLDMAVADFNQDGRYDIVTVNGEVPTSSFDNLYYENVGPQDNTSPMIGRVTELPTILPAISLAAGAVIRSWIQDSVVDDGATYVEAQLDWSVSENGVVVQSSTAMPHIGGGLHRAELLPLATSEGLVGATVSFSVYAADPMGNAISSTPSDILVCGTETYGTVTGLTVSGPDTAGPTDGLRIFVSGGEPNKPGILWRSSAPASISIPGGTLWIDPQGAQRLPFVLDASGSAQISVPLGLNAAGGDEHYVQAFARSSSASTGMIISSGLQAVLCE
jgi:hypothetical protein